MPLFIGISGFLFDWKKLYKLKLNDILAKYKFRRITPWI